MERTADKLMCWLLPTSHLLLVKVAPWSLNYSVLSGLLLGFSRQLLEKQLNLGIGAPVASATVGTKKATKDQPFPWGGQRQLVVLGEEMRSGLGLWPAWSGCSAGKQSSRQVGVGVGEVRDCSQPVVYSPPVFVMLNVAGESYRLVSL